MLPNIKKNKAELCSGWQWHTHLIQALGGNMGRWFIMSVRQTWYEKQVLGQPELLQRETLYQKARNKLI